MKLAVLSHVLPPSSSGQAMILHRLLRHLRPDDYCLLSEEDHEACADLGRLPARYHRLSPAGSLPRPGVRHSDLLSEALGLGGETPSRTAVSGSDHPVPYGFKPRVPGALTSVSLATLERIRGRLRVGRAGEPAPLTEASREDESLEVLRRARSVLRIVEREGCGTILGCSGHPFDLPAGYLASRWAGVPFYAYLFDDYLYQWAHPSRTYLVPRWVEATVLGGAAGIIVPNELLGEEYRRRHGVRTTVIHNPAEAIEPGDGVAWPASRGEIGLTYTGAVYYVNHGAFRSLVTAVLRLGRPDVRLHLYTAQPPEELEQANIRGPIVHNDHLAPSEVIRVQRRADILYLPLAFDSPVPEVVRTASPAKMGEYLASGRPVLAHAPAGSFVSRYFREHGCGVVVDRDDPAALEEAIRRLISDPDLRRRVVENARARAAIDFDLASAQGRFSELLEAGVRG